MWLRSRSRNTSDEGSRVLMMVDSLTRLAMAQRQIGLSAGEPPHQGHSRRIHDASASRARWPGGERSITGLFTVLVEGDDMDDPVADTVRGIVDGHIVLLQLASHGHYPAIDVLQSVSRTMPATTTAEQVAWANRVRALIATYRENEELIRLGAYKPGTDPDVDAAIQAHPAINAFLKQGVEEITEWPGVLQGLGRLAVDSAPRGAGPAGVRRAPRGGEP